MYTIRIQGRTEYCANIENIYQEDSFFYQTYCRAAQQLETILDWSSQVEVRPKGSLGAEERLRLLGYPNNLIAFCGGRGQGKTSNMASFSAALASLSKKEKDSDFRKFWRNMEAKNYSYEVIDRIDPTTMEQQDSIISSILWRMFGQLDISYKKKKEGYTRDFTHGQTLDQQFQELIRLFQRALRTVANLQGEAQSLAKDDIAYIAEMGDSSNLKFILYKLVRAYLAFMQGESQSFLVIQIDDADLNTNKAYDIVENIRKYLTMPRVVILLAVNMEQLEGTVEQHFLSSFSTSIQLGGRMTPGSCRASTEQYIQKVIPSGHQIHLPSLSNVMYHHDSGLQLEYRNDDTSSEGAGDRSEHRPLLKTGATWTYSKQLLDLLHRKIGLCLLEPITYLHNLVPITMRELTHFIAFFRRLQDVSMDYGDLYDSYIAKDKPPRDEDLALWYHNLDQMETYLYHHWGPMYLQKEGLEFLNHLRHLDHAGMHRIILDYLPDYCAKEYASDGYIHGLWTKTPSEYRSDFLEECHAKGVHYDTNGQVYLATYANVQIALDIIKTIGKSNRQYRFIYGIRLCYTIKLHQLFLQAISTGQAMNSVVEFLGEGIFSKESIEAVSISQHFSEFNINPQLFNQLLGKHMTAVREGVVSQFCRIQGDEGYLYRLDNTARQGSMCLNSESHVIFGVFHPLLRTIESDESPSHLSRERDMLKEVWAEHKKLWSWKRNNWIGSVAIFLNYDLQRVVLKNIKKNLPQYLLSEWLKYIYRNLLSFSLSPNGTTLSMEEFFTNEDPSSGQELNDILLLLQLCSKETRAVFFEATKQELEALAVKLNNLISNEPEINVSGILGNANEIYRSYNLIRKRLNYTGDKLVAASEEKSYIPDTICPHYNAAIQEIEVMKAKEVVRVIKPYLRVLSEQMDILRTRLASYDTEQEPQNGTKSRQKHPTNKEQPLPSACKSCPSAGKQACAGVRYTTAKLTTPKKFRKPNR